MTGKLNMNALFSSILFLPLLIFGAKDIQQTSQYGNTSVDKEKSEIFRNSIDIEMLYVDSGIFQMGNENKEYDEKPVHEVRISESFYMSTSPVTFKQFEEFRPDHRKKIKAQQRLTYENPIKKFPEYNSHLNNDDPVVGVSWHDAVEFCEWLSEKEGVTYRLPTEAEWEYVAQKTEDKELDVKDLTGVVEQWLLDWYGPYTDPSKKDPAGYVSGTTKVTRGGSRLTPEQTQRITNRMSFLPNDRYPGLGFRIVRVNDSVELSFKEKREAPLNQQHVSQQKFDWKNNKVSEIQPIFKPVIPFVKIPENSNGPIFHDHNHFPSLTWAPNGDLLATWYSCITEGGTKLNVAASRLRQGEKEWEEASLFWAAVDRNDHSAALWTDPESGILYHFQGTGSYPHQGNQILFMRTSDDSGKSWSTPRIINDTRSMWNPHVVSKVNDSTIVVTSDLNFDQPIWGRIILSRDHGKTWIAPDVEGENTKILGQHPTITTLKDGRLMAIGRDNWNEDHVAKEGSGAPISYSEDGGKTWVYEREPELGNGINWGQRPIILRLNDGALMYIGFTDQWDYKKGFSSNEGIKFKNSNDELYTGYGLFTALSYNEGKTWPVKKLITPVQPGEPSREFDGGGNTRLFTADATHAEPSGYIQAIQTPDGMIHLISSRLHYRFNKKWIEKPAPVAD